MGARLITADEIKQAKAMRRFGLTIGDIAKKLGRSRSGIERVLRDPFSEGRTCSDCSTAISNISKSGRCRACNTILRNKDPEQTAKRVAGKRRSMADPIKYARICQLARDNIRKAMQNPEIRARFVAVGRERAETYFNTPEMRARVNDPELRKAIGRKVSEHRMAWCPPEYRAQYHELLRLRVCSAAEGRKLIAEQIKADKERERANLSPFERQMRALEKGAQLVANDQKPSLANPGVYRAEDAA